MTPITTIRKFVTVAPGVEIYTERRTFSATTNPTETILFIHGLGGSINIFYPVFAAILSSRPESTLLAYDWFGCGLSPYASVSRPTPTAHDLINDIDQLVELEAPEGPLIVIAHSAGTILAIRWFTSPAINSRHISRINSTVLIGGPIALPVTPAVVHMQRQLADVVSTRGPHELLDQVLPISLGPATIEGNPLAVALVRSIMAGHSKEGYAAALRAFSKVSDEGPLLWERLPKAMRILFIGGRDDLSVGPEILKGFAGEVQGSQVVILDVGQ
jgi:pimeloyl-ACP methyl ester carboxylesterase